MQTERTITLDVSSTDDALLRPLLEEEEELWNLPSRPFDAADSAQSLQAVREALRGLDAGRMTIGLGDLRAMLSYGITIACEAEEWARVGACAAMLQRLSAAA